MSITMEINGQLVTLDQSEQRTMLRRLLSEVRTRVWLRVSSAFTYSFDRWEWHFNERNNPIHWVIEAVGGADLPNASTARRLKREHDQLAALINPTGITRFFERLPRWQRDAARFRRSVSRYLNDFDSGGERSVQVLTITRDTSFVTLQVCAALVTGGATASASAAAATATTSVSGALVRNIATTFVINEMRNSSTRLGRTLAGEVVTMRDTRREIGQNALDSVSGAMLGGILGHFMRPLNDAVTAAATREIRSGRLLNGVAIELSNNRFGNAVEQAITQFARNRQNDLREALRDTPVSRSRNDAAQSTSRRMMMNRNFRQELARQLQAEQELMSR